MVVRVKDGKRQVNVGKMLNLLWRNLTESFCQEVFQKIRTTERERKWALYPLVWFWVLLTARGIPSVRAAVKQARQGWEGMFRKVESSRQALGKRAQKLHWKFFREVFHRFVEKVAGEIQPRYCPWIQEVLERFPRVWVVDGSKLDPIAHRLKILRAVKDRVLPGMVFAVYDLFQGIPRLVEFCADAARSEYQMAIEGMRSVPAGTLVLGDRLYGGVKFLAELGRQGAWGVVRKHGSVKLRARKLLSRVNRFGMTLEDWRVQVGTGKDVPTLRYIRLIEGGRTFEWFTNVLDVRKLSVEVPGLYAQRWSIERMFAALKCVLDLKSFHLAHPNGVAQQVYAAALVYVALRVLQGEIGYELGMEPDLLSIAKLFPRMREAIHDYGVAKQTVSRIQTLNARKKLRLPNLKNMEFCWVDEEDLLVEHRVGRGGTRRGKPNWKSLRHIKGGSAWLN